MGSEYSAALRRFLSNARSLFFCQVCSKEEGAYPYSIECINDSCEKTISFSYGKILLCRKSGVVCSLYALPVTIRIAFFCIFTKRCLFFAVHPYIIAVQWVKYECIRAKYSAFIPFGGIMCLACLMQYRELVTLFITFDMWVSKVRCSSKCIPLWWTQLWSWWTE